VYKSQEEILRNTIPAIPAGKVTVGRCVSHASPEPIECEQNP